MQGRYKKRFNLAELRWNSIFNGVQPKFVVQKAKKKPSLKKGIIDLTGEDELIKKAKVQKKLKKMLEKNAKMKSKKAVNEAKAKLREGKC